MKSIVIKQAASNVNFVKSFLGVSTTQSGIYLGCSFLVIILILLIRVLTKRIWVKKADLSWSFSLYFGIFAALVLGLIFAGLNHFNGLNQTINKPTNEFEITDDYIFQITSLNKVYASLFLSTISLIVGPLIFFGLGSKIANYKHTHSLQKSLIYMIIAVFLAVIFGIFVLQVFRLVPNLLINNSETNKAIEPKYTSILLTIADWIPKNVLGSKAFTFVSISLLVFALILGFAIFLAKKHNPQDQHLNLAANFLVSGFKVFSVVTELILELMPIGVFGLFTNAIIINGGNIFLSLAYFIGAFLGALLIIFLLQLITIWSIVKINPISYLKKAAKPLLSAFLTQSSNLTTPLSQKALLENFKINPQSASAMPIIGTTMGMVACGALYPVMAAGFIFFVNNPFNDMSITVQINFFLILIFGTFFSSFGISGTPGVASVVVRNVFSITNLPFSAFVPLLTVDPLIDMFRTLVNVNGILVATILGDHQSKKTKKLKIKKNNIKHLKNNSNNTIVF